MKFLFLMSRNMWNNKIRTALTIVGVAVAVGVFCFFQSMQSTMDGVVDEAGQMNNLVVLKENAW